MNQKHIDKIESAISELIYEKIQLRKAYNYYHCIRDAEQFRHIEDNYGIGTPTTLGFTPLIKKHIDVLVGEYLGLDPELSISCKDQKTISNIQRDKKLKIDQTLYNHLKGYLENMIINVISNGQDKVDPFIENELKQIYTDLNKSFTSEYEIAAQNILKYLRQSRNIDLKNKLRELFTDLLITGCCYYRIKPNSNEDNVKFEICNPLDTFVEKSRNEYFLNKSSRSVIRRWMTKEEILKDFGRKLTKEHVSELDEQIGKGLRDGNAVFIRQDRTLSYDSTTGQTGVRQLPTPGILGGLEVSPIYPYSDSGMYNYLGRNVIAVYEVEWIEYDYSKHKIFRYQGVKIGNNIYICPNKDDIKEFDPDDFTLSVNGIFFLGKNGSPFSMVLGTSDLQDKYDLLIYYRDNLIATSGTVGDWIDLAHIPSVLGVELPDRLEKWIAYKKNGLALFDSSQEGANMINTTFNGYDDTVKVQSIQAIQLAIDSVEMQAAAITGVFPEKLGGIEQRDAVSNVKVGIKYSSLLTKQYFSAMDLLYKEVNYDALNTAKVVYKKGITGEIILGPKLVKIFTALPEHFTLTDYDIHVQDSTEGFQDKETLKMLTTELIKANQADPEMIINIISTKSLTELKAYISDAMKMKKEENNQLAEMSNQIKQYEENRVQLESQLKQISDENKRLQKQLETSDMHKLELDKKRISLEEKDINNKKDYNDKTIDIKNRELDVQTAQLYDSNPYNDKIKSS